MYTRLTTEGRTFFAVLAKILGYGVVIALGTGGVVVAGNKVAPAVSAWWNRPSAPQKVFVSQPAAQNEPPAVPAADVIQPAVYSPLIVRDDDRRFELRDNEHHHDRPAAKKRTPAHRENPQPQKRELRKRAW